MDGRRLDPRSIRMEHLEPGGALETGHGAAEVVLGAGRLFRLAPDSRARLRDAALDAVDLELIAGSAYLTWSEFSGNKGSISVSMAGARCAVGRFGAYRIDAPPDLPARLRVYDGKAAATAGEDSLYVKSKRELILSAPPEIRRFDPEDLDSFDRWNARRNRRVRRLSRAGNRNRRRNRNRNPSPLPSASERGAPRLGGR